MVSFLSFFRRAAESYPFLFFVLIAYAWSWPFWWFAYFGELVPGMKLALVLLGVFGPALAGITLLHLRNNQEKTQQSGRWSFFCLGAILAALAIAAFRFDFMGVMALVPSADHGVPDETPWYVYIMFAGVVALSGFVISQARSNYPTVRSFLTGLVPDRRTLLLSVPVLLFLPALMISANLVADLVGIPYDTPLYLTMPLAEWLPLLAVKLFTVAMLTGGNEEYGWRGVLLPLMQKKYSPLVATLLIALLWEPWHIPLTLDIVGTKENYWLIVFARYIAILPIALTFTILYNFSRGSIFLCVLMHAGFNTYARLFAGSELFALGLLIAVAIGIIALKMWRKGRGYVPEVTGK